MDTANDLLIAPVAAVPRSPVVLVPPHFGARFPSNFDAIVSEFDRRDGEDGFVDALFDRYATGPLNG